MAAALWGVVALAWAGVASALPSVRLNVQRVVGFTQDDLGARYWTFIGKDRLSVSRNLVEKWRSMEPNGIGIKLIEDAADDRERETFHSTQIYSLCNGLVQKERMSVSEDINGECVVWHDDKASVFYLEARTIQKIIEVCFKMSSLPRTDEESFYDNALSWSSSDISDLTQNSHCSVIVLKPEIAHQANFDFNPSSLARNKSITCDIGGILSSLGGNAGVSVGSEKKPDLGYADSRQDKGQESKNRSEKGGRVSDKPFHEWLIEFAALCFCVLGGLAVCTVGLVVLMQGENKGNKA